MLHSTAFAPSHHGTGKAPPRHLPLPAFRGSGTQISVESRPLANQGICASLTLILAFDMATGMVAAYRLVEWPWDTLAEARTVVDAIRQLHVPKNAEVDIVGSGYAFPEQIEGIVRLTGRRRINADYSWSARLWSDRMATELARRVENNVLFEQAIGNAALGDTDDRLFFLEAMVDRVIGWHHRHPVAGAGSLSPAELHAERLRAGLDAKAAG